MKPRKIEDILKEDLNDYVSEVDMKKLWSDIEQEVEAVEVKSTSKTNYITIAGLSVFVCGILLCLWMQEDGSDLMLKQEASNNATEIVESNMLAEDSFIQKVEIEENANFEQKSMSNEFKILKGKQKEIGKTNGASINFERGNIEFSTQKDKGQTISDETKIIAKTKGLKFKNKGVDAPKTIFVSPLAFEELKELNTTFVDSTFLRIENLLKQNQLAEESENEDYRRKPDFQFSTGLYGGASLALRKLSDKSGENTDYLKMREDTETSLETLQTGLKIAVEHKSGVALQTGFQFMQITERFEFSGSRIRRDTIEDGIFAYLINPNGDTIPVYDQIINTQEVNIQKLEYNRYRFLDIPLSAAYFVGDDDWSIGLHAGVVLNLALKTEGEIFDAFGEIQDLKETNFFKSNVGLTYRGAISGRYLINDNLQLEATVHGRFFPKTITSNTYHLNQKYTIVGLNVGLNYLF